MRTLALTLLAALAVAGCDGAFGRSSTVPAPTAVSGEKSGSGMECCPLSGKGPAADAAPAAECSAEAKAECRKACEDMPPEAREACEKACETECETKCEEKPAPKD